MGGPGSGGYKNKPGDTETHSAWDIIPQDPDGTQVNVVIHYPRSKKSPLTGALETRPGTMQVLWEGDGPAHLAAAGASAELPTIPRSHERPGSGD